MMPMTINESSNDSLYQAYRNAGPTAALILPAVVVNIPAISGVFLNSIVVIITLLTKSLHGTSNFLISLLCFFEILHQSGHIVFLVIVISGINFISLLDAFYLDSCMIFGFNASIFCMTCAALDRLFAVVAQNKHKSLNKPIYLAVHIFLCILYGIYGAFNIYQNLIITPNAPSTASISDIYAISAKDVFRNTIILNGISACFYIAVGIVIRLKKGVTKETNAKLLKSLIIILAISLGGYCINLTILQILNSIYHLSSIWVWELGYINGFLLNLGVALNGPILYINSSEYRKAFKRHFNNFFELLGRNSQQSTGGGGTLFRQRSNQVNPIQSLATHEQRQMDRIKHSNC